ncbi:hypothetical protein Hanom_Chr14g01261631 [Helianthus anomalus]
MKILETRVVTMYPRFIQMILDDLVPNLSKDPANELKLHHMNTKTLNRLNKYKGLTADQEPRVKRMFGKIANLNYVAPENDAWRHENSNSEDETGNLRGMHEKKLRFWFVKDGKRKRTPKVSPKVEKPKIVIKERSKKKSPPRLVDEPVVDPTELLKQGTDLLNMTFDQYIKHTVDEAAKAAAKVQSFHVEKVAETSTKNVEAKSVKVKEAEGVVEIDSSATESEPEYDTSKLGVGKIKLKVEVQSVKAPEAETTEGLEAKKKKPESPEYVRVEENVEAEKGDDKVQYMGERKSTPPASPINPTIHIQDGPKKSPEKKDTSSGSYDGFPTVHGEFPFDLPEGDYDMFHDGKIKVLTKKVSSLEKGKAKVEGELKAVKAGNEELKKAYNNHAEIIDDLNDTIAEQAKVIDRITQEFVEVNTKYENMNEVNKTLHHMIYDLHETSSNENKVLRQEIEAPRANKVVKDEQLNMLYIVMEHKLGINFQAVYNDLEIQRVEQKIN